MKLLQINAPLGEENSLLGELDSFRGFEPHQTKNCEVSEDNQDAQNY